MALPDIIREIQSSNSFLVTSHIRPDGDAIGSLLGMVRLLHALGKDAIPVMHDPTPDKYSFLPDSETVKTVKEAENFKPFDCAVVLDVGDFERIGDVRKLISDSTRVVNIDHHVSNNGFGHAAWISSSSCATAEMLLELYREIKIIPDKESANQLYTGIMTDTGRFRFSNTSPSCLVSAGKLVELGANPSRIAELVFYRTNPRNLEILSKVLSRIELFQSEQIATTYISLDEKDADSDGFVDELMGINTIEVGAIFNEVEKDYFKVSLRSNGDVDVSMVANQFRGGGHKKAAGCRLNGPFPEARDTIVKALKAVL
ncbi:bifunctional oligoribonuclease/PAP phosphatase NrnA [bacterium]|nr:bifunctional oligoribonuclease/PAP phosphatase NrnA [bacterium]